MLQYFFLFNSFNLQIKDKSHRLAFDSAFLRLFDSWHLDEEVTIRSLVHLVAIQNLLTFWSNFNFPKAVSYTTHITIAQKCPGLSKPAVLKPKSLYIC